MSETAEATPFEVHWRLIVVVVVTIAAFSAVIHFPFSIVDDPSNVVNNPLVAQPFSQGLMALLRTTPMGYPHTVTVLSFAIDRRLFGVDPSGYHAVNVAIHLVNVMLMYALLLRLGITIRVAWLPAAIFALHPIMVEPVAWVIGRKDLLATGFLLGAFVTVASGPERSDGPLRDRRWPLAIALCVLAIFAKPSAIMAPALMWLFIRCVRPSWRFAHILTGLVPVAAAGAFTVLVGVPGLEDQGAVVRRAPPEIAFDIIRAWTLQVQHVVWPRGLLAEYERTALDDPPRWIIAAVMAATLAIAVWGWRRNAPRSLERMALLFVPVAYLPAAGFLPTWHWTADSYFYLPMVGIVMLVGAVLQKAWRAQWNVAWAAVPLLAFLAHEQTFTWSSGSATFGPVAAHYASDPRPLNRLAFAHLFEGKPDLAAPLFVKLEQMAPEFPFNRAQRAWAAYRLGDSAMGDALMMRCVAAQDVQCVVSFRDDLLSGGIAKDRPSPTALTAVASLLRQRGLGSPR